MGNTATLRRDAAHASATSGHLLESLGVAALFGVAAGVLPTMALLDAARESSRTGAAVDVREVVEWVL